MSIRPDDTAVMLLQIEILVKELDELKSSQGEFKRITFKEAGKAAVDRKECTITLKWVIRIGSFMVGILMYLLYAHIR